MSTQPEHVLVIGAGLGGLRTAEQLRAAGFQGRISLVGAEAHPPYDRPPLSKQVLSGAWETDRVVLSTVDALTELGVRTHLGLSAVGLGPGVVELSDGSALHGDAVVVATGLAARALPGQPDRVHTLRTLDDSLALRATLERVSSLLVVGAGFIGAEVASTARERGIAVTVLEALPVPSVRALGARLGALAGRLLTEGGVDLRTEVKITGMVPGPAEPTGVTAQLADGTEVVADAAVVGIGGEPRLDWLAGSGAAVAGGLTCGPTGRVVGLDATWAVGDVALWEDPTLGGHHRHEHWTSAGDQAAVVARDILGAQLPPPAVPYFWSDQFGLKIQLLGHPDAADDVVGLHGDGLDGGPIRGTVAAYFTGDRLAAVAGFGAARRIVRYRQLVAAGASRAETLAHAASL